MYARKVGERELTFVVSGKLWQRSLVMEDVETKSLWSHLLGRAMAGALKDKELAILPSSITDWKTWKAAHPDGSVLAMSRTAKEFVRDAQNRPGQFVLGIHRLGGKSRAYSFDLLRGKPVVNDALGERLIVVRFDPVTSAGHIFDRKARERELEFEAAEAPDVQLPMRDTATGSLWSGQSGACVEGELKGTQLKVMVGIPSYRRAWFDFFPDATEFGKDG